MPCHWVIRISKNFVPIERSKFGSWSINFGFGWFAGLLASRWSLRTTWLNRWQLSKSCFWTFGRSRWGGGGAFLMGGGKGGGGGGGGIGLGASLVALFSSVPPITCEVGVVSDDPLKQHEKHWPMLTPDLEGSTLWKSLWCGLAGQRASGDEPADRMLHVIV